jgi:hypothetical protein
VIPPAQSWGLWLISAGCALRYDESKTIRQTPEKERVMNELTMIIEVTILFFIRIGIPLLLLIVLGVVVDRWQSHREAQVRSYYQQHQPPLRQS